MKTLYNICFIMVLGFILIGCSTDDFSTSNPAPEKATLSFGIVLNDMDDRQMAVKQESSNLPVCKELQPAFLEVIVLRDGIPVAGSDEKPLRMELDPASSVNMGDGGNYYAEESASLKLDPGTYTLQHFRILDENEELLWVAPVKSEVSGMADYVKNPLPLEFSLDAGTKKYQAVDVVCYDKRFVNQYGYSFFGLNEMKTIPFCIFGNFCFNDGRHAAAVHFKTDVWMYSGDSENPKGDLLYSDQENIITDTNDGSGESSAEPLCLALPDGDGVEEFYFEISLLNNGQEVEKLIRTGVITDGQVRSLLSENSVEYYHFREGACNLEDSPRFFEKSETPGIDPNLDSDRDGIADIEDNCPYQYNPDQRQGLVDYFGEACFTPCTLITDEDDQLMITSDINGEFIEIEHLGEGFSLDPLDGGYSPVYAMVFLRDSHVEVGITVDAGNYLEDHLIEVKDDIDSEVHCILIPPQLIEEVQGGPSSPSYDSWVELPVPEDFSFPYFIRVTGNLYIGY